MAEASESSHAALVRVVLVRPTGRLHKRGRLGAHLPGMIEDFYPSDAEARHIEREILLRTYPVPFGDSRIDESIRPDDSSFELRKYGVVRLASPNEVESLRLMVRQANELLQTLARDYWASHDGEKTKKMLSVLEVDDADIIESKHWIEISIENLDISDFLGRGPLDS